MSNIKNYIRNYSNITFEEEDFNEIDNLVFSTLTYLNFSNIVSEKRKYITLNDAGKIYFDNNSFDSIKKYGKSAIDAYRVLKEAINSDRYKDVLLYSYCYIGDNNKQFGAISFKVKKDLTVIAFEGTDYLISGWKEDFQMSYKFPVPSQTCARKYLNKNISLFDKNVIVIGHSKGGNLALVSSMYCRKYLRRKIKLIYNNDGPGLRSNELNSKNYKRIKDRYIHIVPNYSYVGVLLKNDNYKVIKSSRIDILAHSVMYWEIKDNKLVSSNLSTMSKRLEKSTNMWLDKYDNSQREKVVTIIFDSLENNGIYNANDLLDFRKLSNIINNLNDIDKESKEIIINLIKFNIDYLISDLKSNINNIIS